MSDISQLSGCGVLPALEEEYVEERRPATPEKTKRKRNVSERFQLLNTFVDFSMRHLNWSEIRVWMVLYRDSREGVARTSQEDIARRAGVSRVTVTRAIKRLKKCGLLQVVRQGGLGRGMSSYRLFGQISEACISRDT